MRPTFILIGCLLFFGRFINAQVPTIQDCLGAIPVCQQTYIETDSPTGVGNFPNEINGLNSCTDGEINSIWYVFTANEDGNLGFVITPNDLDDDYDWALFDITNATCEDIFTDPNLSVSCNAAGGGGCHGATGANGETSWSVQGPGCNANPPSQFAGSTPFNDFVPMQEGNTYVLMVSNWTGSENGYTIDFGSSTGLGIIDETIPEVSDAIFPDECNENTITIEFSEYIQCSTIEDANFALAGPGGPYTVSVSSDGCEQGDYERTFTLTVDPPLEGLGDYQLALLTDGSTEVLDLCDNPAQTQLIPFSIILPIAVNPDIGPDTTLLCDGNTLVLDATFPSAIGYQWQDGSTDAELTISTGGIYAVTVTALCGTGVDSVEVFVQMDVPEVDLGPDLRPCPGEILTLDVYNDLSTYLWQDGSNDPSLEVSTSGTYSVDVTNACGTVSDEVEVFYYLPLTTELGPDQVLCAGDTLFLDVTHLDEATYLWENGSTVPDRIITQTGDYAVTVTTPCESISDVVTVQFIEEPLFDLGLDTVLCFEETLDFDLSVAGATYLWQDGSTSPQYSIVQSGDYMVTIQTACSDILDSINVVILDTLSVELGRDTFYCPGYDIRLDAFGGENTMASYEWQDGNDERVYIIREAGIYTVRTYNICEEVFDQATIFECEVCDVYVPNAFSPNDDGINDYLQPFSDCPLEDFKMTVFDRWGGMIYESRSVEKGWDGDYRGEPAGEGYYVWFMTFRVYENNLWRTVEMEGGVNLLR
ncbi:MAG: gliding motility-associated C-terminal domain-containing protein [Bacteroidetes bacterium]|nr:MAG: gliding motility-associated C-terminal domain-containing protein [Bacteroidota bacterium]